MFEIARAMQRHVQRMAKAQLVRHNHFSFDFIQEVHEAKMKDFYREINFATFEEECDLYFWTPKSDYQYGGYDECFLGFA